MDSGHGRLGATLSGAKILRVDGDGRQSENDEKRNRERLLHAELLGGLLAGEGARPTRAIEFATGRSGMSNGIRNFRKERKSRSLVGLKPSSG